MRFIPKMIVGLILLMSYSPSASAQLSLELPSLTPTLGEAPWYVELQTAYLFEENYFSDFDGFGSIILGVGKNRGKTITGLNLEFQSYQTARDLINNPINASFQSYNRTVVGGNLSFTHAYRLLDLSLLRIYAGPTGVLGGTYQDIESILSTEFPVRIVNITLGLGGKLNFYWHLNDAWAINMGLRLILINMTWDSRTVDDPSLTVAQRRNAGFEFLIPRPEFYAPLGVTYFFGT